MGPFDRTFEKSKCAYDTKKLLLNLLTNFLEMSYLARGAFRASWSKMTTLESYSKKLKAKADIPSISLL